MALTSHAAVWRHEGLRLLVADLADREIAAILTKLGAPSRGAATTRAVRDHLA
jgi:hypothetical protein